MIRNPSSIRFEDRAFVIALASIHDRIRLAPEQDRHDLKELTIEFLDAAEQGDAERQDCAADAILEILEQRPVRVLEMTVPDDDGTLRRWNESLGNRIRQLRAAAGMTQEELAAKSGIGQSHLSRLEAGQHSPNALTLEKIAQALNMPARDIQPSAPV